MTKNRCGHNVLWMNRCIECEIVSCKYSISTHTKAINKFAVLLADLEQELLRERFLKTNVATGGVP